MAIQLGRHITGIRDMALEREWLVTNGLGGYAMGTVAGARTRRYHGLLVVPLQPPTQRHLLLAAADTWVEIQNRRVPIITHEWTAGVVLPDGYNNLEHFRLEGAMPVFRWAIGSVIIEQRIWMAHGENTTYITWHYQRGTEPVRLIVKPLITYRSHHDITTGGPRITITAIPSPWGEGLGLDILPAQYLGTPKYETVPQPYRLITPNTVRFTPGDWWWNFLLREEKGRGLKAEEDLYHVGTLEGTLNPGETFCLTATVETHIPETWQTALAKEQERQRGLIRLAHSETAPDWIQQLIVAADQFMVSLDDDAYIMGGYPWFGVWGRDTMASLTGLTAVLGRHELTAKVLRTFSRYINQGMMPNTLSDDNGEPSYNSIDAALWFIVAVWAYMREMPDDLNFLREMYPVLTEIIDWYHRGTRYKIAEDPKDGLLFGGETGSQLTWMDAKVNEWVVTPRIGKAVEVNALWYNALRIMAEFAERLKQPAHLYSDKAERVLESFNRRFWSEKKGYLYDVIDPKDDTLRPNQLLALSLPFRVLTDDTRAKQVVDRCAAELLTSGGLRTLSYNDPQYVGNYGGNAPERDGAYHQGTVWAWLIGPFASAHLTVYNDPQTALSFIEPFSSHLFDQGIGTIGEICDGNSPFRPRGAIAQAWSVAEVLRVWWDIQRHQS